MITIKKRFYGELEPNQLSAQKNGSIYASLPLDPEVEILQNGEFMYYDYAKNMVCAETESQTEPMLVYNEVKLYDDWRVSYKDFAMIRVGENSYVTERMVAEEMKAAADTSGDDNTWADNVYNYRLDGIVPRVFKTQIGDIFTTNMLKDGEYSVGDFVAPALNSDTHTLQLEKVGGIQDGMTWVVAKEYTMPDGEPAVKLQRVK